MPNDVAGSGAGTGDGSGAGAGADAASKDSSAGGEGKSILDSAVAGKSPDKGEPNGKASDASGKAADGSKPAGEEGSSKTEGAPEKYEPFKAPEGMTLDGKAVETFNALAKELNLSQASAQKLVDFQTSMVKASEDKALQDFKDMQKDWAEQTKKALGNDADKQLGYAAAFRDKFLSDATRQVLRDSGLDNHPEIIQAFIRAGKAMAEDTFAEGRPAGGKKNEGKTAAQVIYPEQK